MLKPFHAIILTALLLLNSSCMVNDINSTVIKHNFLYRYDINTNFEFCEKNYNELTYLASIGNKKTVYPGFITAIRFSEVDLVLNREIGEILLNIYQLEDFTAEFNKLPSNYKNKIIRLYDVIQPTDWPSTRKLLSQSITIRSSRHQQAGAAVLGR